MKGTMSTSGLAQDAFVLLVRVRDERMAELTALLRPAGLSEPQFNVLRILRGAGPEGLSCREIGARMVSRVPDVTRLLDRLEAAGHVTRRRAPAEDRRRVLVHITEGGRRLLDSLDAPVRRLHDRQFEGLSRVELETLVGLLNRARSGT
jgi:DNA-binding MarR family transcriptional regulator